MAKTKGTDIVALRRYFRELGPESEKRFYQTLSPEVQNLYDTILATSWTEVEKQMAIYQAAADFLFPGDTVPMTSLGKLLAKRSFSGVYRFFLRVPSIQFIFKRAANIWRAYYNTGNAAVKEISPRTIELVVNNFPDMPRPMREMAMGHYRVILETAGAKNIRMDMLDNNPQAWRWRVSWE